ncbi:hypothetical protein [Desulfovibrio legallii]|uniref:Uncharacterized protein n=1 Tax=Desulfovibrio legallii TaxID=571438 RepID=A0A1G7Q644_9BACT|nr:hypothetical protein [Desulfovibrio legallii]SDF94057.1 hypothetical protein SAMN05192586_11945 [Desulfovibrio legallii]
MNERWLVANRDFLVRDLVRDYCTVYNLLADQRRRFEADGAVSYSALRDLLGEAMRKGVFWRLKDTAHHLFRNSLHAEDMAEADVPPLPLPAPQNAPADALADAAPSDADDPRALEALIDWCVGYAFHECAKLKEDAFQGQHYANRLVQIARNMAVSAATYNPLRGLGGQTAESSSRELARIMHVLSHGLRLLARYLAAERCNTRLARWLASEEDLAAQAFGQSYALLLDSLCQGNRERLYLLAAQDFLEAGRRAPALALLARASADGRLGPEGQALLQRLHQAEEAQDPGVCADCAQQPPLPCLCGLEGPACS